MLVIWLIHEWIMYVNSLTGDLQPYCLVIHSSFRREADSQVMKGPNLPWHGLAMIHRLAYRPYFIVGLGYNLWNSNLRILKADLYPSRTLYDIFLSHSLYRDKKKILLTENGQKKNQIFLYLYNNRSKRSKK